MNVQSPDQPSIELYIERLVLDERLLGCGSSEIVRAAIEVELARLLQRSAFNSADSNAACLQAGDITLAGQSPAGLGRQIARRLHGCFFGPYAKGLDSALSSGKVPHKAGLTSGKVQL